MEYEIRKKSNKKRISFIVLTLIMFVGISLAAVYFIYHYKDSRENQIKSSLISIDFLEGSGVINLENTVPVIDEIGLSNTPYTFTIKNTSLVPINANIKLEVNDSTNIDLGAVKYAFYIDSELIKTDYVHDDLILYTYENFKPNKIINGKLVFWIDYYYDKPNKTFSAKIKADGESFDTIINNKYTVTLDPNDGVLSNTNLDVTVGSNYENLPTPTRDGYTFLGWSFLNDNYKQIEYIESNGTQYIDLGFLANQNTGFYIDYINYNELSSSTGYSIFGTRTESYEKGYQLTTYTSDHVTAGHFLFGTNIERDYTKIRYDAGIVPGTRQQISFKNLVLTKPDGNAIIVNDDTFETTTNLVLFALQYSNGQIGEKSSSRIYNVNFYDDDNLIRALVPCYDIINSKYGLYDIVNNHFYEDSDTLGDEFGHGTDSYVNSNTKVTINSNHTLYAKWQENN